MKCGAGAEAFIKRSTSRTRCHTPTGSVRGPWSSRWSSGRITSRSQARRHPPLLRQRQGGGRLPHRNLSGRIDRGRREAVFTKDGDGRAKGILLEADRRFPDVIVKDGGRFETTGGWGYEHFDGDDRTGRLSENDRAACSGVPYEGADRSRVQPDAPVRAAAVRSEPIRYTLNRARRPDRGIRPGCAICCEG